MLVAKPKNVVEGKYLVSCVDSVDTDNNVKVCPVSHTGHQDAGQTSYGSVG